jgi:hypothetical protein
MKASLICSYVDYRKPRRSLQGHAGSFICYDGTFGEVVWKGSMGVRNCGGTLRKNARVQHPQESGKGTELPKHNLINGPFKTSWSLPAGTYMMRFEDYWMPGIEVKEAQPQKSCSVLSASAKSQRAPIFRCTTRSPENEWASLIVVSIGMHLKRFRYLRVRRCYDISLRMMT